jgi:hypothetical protein
LTNTYIFIFCFVEREENVKADIFHAYITLLRQTRPTVSSDPDAMEQDGEILLIVPVYYIYKPILSFRSFQNPVFLNFIY